MVDPGWYVSSLTIIATIFNVLGKRYNFYIYFTANIGWITYWLIRREYFAIPMFAVMCCMNIFGLIQWKRKGVKATK